MTPTEHETYALKMRALALQTLVDWNADLWHELGMQSESAARSEFLSAMRKKLLIARADYQEITLQGVHPVESDLRAALFQEAFDLASEKMMKIIEHGL